MASLPCNLTCHKTPKILFCKPEPENLTLFCSPFFSQVRCTLSDKWNFAKVTHVHEHDPFRLIHKPPLPPDMQLQMTKSMQEKKKRGIHVDSIMLTQHYALHPRSTPRLFDLFMKAD